MSIYIFAIFTSSFPYFSVEVGAIATGIVVVGVIAYRGKGSGLRDGIS